MKNLIALLALLLLIPDSPCSSPSVLLHGDSTARMDLGYNREVLVKIFGSLVTPGEKGSMNKQIDTNIVTQKIKAS